jgi:hypothetical protein
MEREVKGMMMSCNEWTNWSSANYTNFGVNKWDRTNLRTQITMADALNIDTQSSFNFR